MIMICWCQDTPGSGLDQEGIKPGSRLDQAWIKTKAHDYSTSAFLLQWDHFMAVRGRPAQVVSDQGSQLTTSDNTVKFDSLKWE